MLFQFVPPAVLSAAEGIEQRREERERSRRSPPSPGSQSTSCAADGLRLLNIGAWPAPTAAAACALLLAATILIDLSTGPDLALAPYYLLPIILASLCFQVRGGLVVALASTFLTTWPSPVSLSQWGHPLVFAANGVSHGLMYAFVAVVAGGLQRQRQQLRVQREALREAHGFLQGDLQAAAALQRHLLRRPTPVTAGLEVATEIGFARGVGGDFYDVRQIGRSLALCIADVSGKGPRAALISAALRALLDEIAGQCPDPLVFLRHLNSSLAEDLPDGMFITMFYGRLDLKTGELWYASAGHDPPMICRGERVDALEPTAPALGMVDDLFGSTARTTLRPGETLLLYTDGLTTARHVSGDRVGEERVAECLREWASPGNTRTPTELIAELMALACTAQSDLEDDVAVIALRPR